MSLKVVSCASSLNNVCILCGRHSFPVRYSFFFQFFNVLFIQGGTKRIVQTTRSLSLDNRNRKGVLRPMSFVLLLRSRRERACHSTGMIFANLNLY